MIQRISWRKVATVNHTFDVEVTPGGHFVKVVSQDRYWAGLYRCEQSLVLLARCVGEPPTELAVDQRLRGILMEMISGP